MNVEAAFRPLSELEKSMAELYYRWSELFDADREAAFLWVKMGNEERAHALLVDYQRRVIQRNPALSGDVDIEMKSIDEALAEVAAHRKAIQPPSLANAVAIAYRLETSAAESHYRNATKSLNPELQRLLSNLGSEDRGHLDRLKSFAASRGFDLGTPQ